MAAANFSSDNISILLGTGSGAFGPANNFAVGANPLFVALGDLNGDGQLDVVVANNSGNNVSILVNTTALSDQEAPNTSITSGPSGTSIVTSATFTWTGSDNVTAAGNLVYAYRLHPIEASFSAYASSTTKSYTNLTIGSYTFYVKAKDQAGNEDQTPAARSFAVGTNVPDITVTPTSLDFGYVQFGRKSEKIVTVKNDGAGNLIVWGANAFPEGATLWSEFRVISDNCTGVNLPANGSCTISVQFQPASYFPRSAYLKIFSDDPDESVVNVSLSGGGGPPEVTASPMPVEFGSVALGKRSDSKTVTIKNEGTGFLYLSVGGPYERSSSGSSVNSENFSILNRTCVLPGVAPNNSCSITVSFKPKSTGFKIAHIVIGTNDPDERTLEILLSGTGIP